MTGVARRDAIDAPRPTTGCIGTDRSAIDAFRNLAACGRLDQPGGGRTWARFEALADASRASLSAGRLLEAHADGQSILIESGCAEPEAFGLLGVWASDGGDDPVRLRRTAHGYVLQGTKAFCSGAPVLDHALVSATSGGDRWLALVDLRDDRVVVAPSTWTGAGMRETATRSVELHDVPVVDVVGPAGWYLERPGFWYGAIGVAASWFGGAAGVFDTLQAGTSDRDPHRLAHLGEADATIHAMAATLEAAAGRIDAGTLDPPSAHRLALQVRGVVAPGCLTVIEHAAAALGPRAMAFDRDHGQRIVDLDLYVRQDHGRCDREQLGRLVLDTRSLAC
jgi:alkylation response protein AidB-like acyl-CoA dehydrogenase